MLPFRVDDLLFAISATLLGSVVLVTRGGAEPLIDPHAAFLAAGVSAPLVVAPESQREGQVEAVSQSTMPTVQATSPADVRQSVVSSPSASNTIPQAPRPRHSEHEDREEDEFDDD